VLSAPRREQNLYANPDADSEVLVRSSIAKPSAMDNPMKTLKFCSLQTTTIARNALRAIYGVLPMSWWCPQVVAVRKDWRAGLVPTKSDKGGSVAPCQHNLFGRTCRAGLPRQSKATAGVRRRRATPG